MRPLEYVSFFSLQLKTREGPGYLFVVFDPYLDYIFQANVERDESPASVLKNVYYLLENPKFSIYMDDGFTLIFEQYEELASKIMRIIEPAKGKVLFDRAFSNHISSQAKASFVEFLKGKRR